MKRPLYDHLWTKMIETNGIAEEVVRSKLSDLKLLHQAISDKDGSEAADNVLDNGNIEQALKRCLQYHEGLSDLTMKDLAINYGYASHAILKAQKIIDTELSDLDL